MGYGWQDLLDRRGLNSDPAASANAPPFGGLDVDNLGDIAGKIGRENFYTPFDQLEGFLPLSLSLP